MGPTQNVIVRPLKNYLRGREVRATNLFRPRLVFFCLVFAVIIKPRFLCYPSSFFRVHKPPRNDSILISVLLVFFIVSL